MKTYVNTPGSDSVNCQPLVSSSTDILNIQGTVVAWQLEICNKKRVGDVTRQLCCSNGSDVNNKSRRVSPLTMDAETDVKAANRPRFELELEFVQALANPFYLHSLAQQNILEQPAFVNFLKYLLYFKEKDYARFIQYVYTF